MACACMSEQQLLAGAGPSLNSTCTLEGEVMAAGVRQGEHTYYLPTKDDKSRTELLDTHTGRSSTGANCAAALEPTACDSSGCRCTLHCP